MSQAKAREVQITFDCADPDALATFWAAALTYEKDPPPPGFETWDQALDAWGVPEDRRNDRSAVSDPGGSGPRLFFQKVPEGKTSKNRVHLDIRAAPGLRGEERMAALEGECTRLEELGATRVRRQDPGAMDAGHIVMQDLEGNEFCLD